MIEFTWETLTQILAVFGSLGAFGISVTNVTQWLKNLLNASGKYALALFWVVSITVSTTALILAGDLVGVSFSLPNLAATVALIGGVSTQWYQRLKAEVQ